MADEQTKLAPTLESKEHPGGLFFVAESRDSFVTGEKPLELSGTDYKYIVSSSDSSITYFDGKRTLDINLVSGAPVANHLFSKGDETHLRNLDDLFANEEDIKWGLGQKEKIQESERAKQDYNIKIATAEHPIRWTSGRGLVIVDGYAIMNKRASYAPIDPDILSDMGGFGEKPDLFNPGYGAHREIAEELAIFSPDGDLLIPKIHNHQTRGVDFEWIMKIACRDTKLSYKNIKRFLAKERKDLADDSEIIVRHNGEIKFRENLQFNYDPKAKCGIDVMTTLEYHTGLNPIKDLMVGLAEYYGPPDNLTIIGSDNDLAFIRIEDLLNEFDRGKNAVPVEAHLRNVYLDGKRDIIKIDPVKLINMSTKVQLENMKRMGYQFGK